MDVRHRTHTALLSFASNIALLIIDVSFFFIPNPAFCPRHIQSVEPSRGSESLAPNWFCCRPSNKSIDANVYRVVLKSPLGVIGFINLVGRFSPWSLLRWWIISNGTEAVNGFRVVHSRNIVFLCLSSHSEDGLPRDAKVLYKIIILQLVTPGNLPIAERETAKLLIHYMDIWSCS